MLFYLYLFILISLFFITGHFIFSFIDLSKFNSPFIVLLKSLFGMLILVILYSLLQTKLHSVNIIAVPLIIIIIIIIIILKFPKNKFNINVSSLELKYLLLYLLAGFLFITIQLIVSGYIFNENYQFLFIVLQQFLSTHQSFFAVLLLHL